MSEEEIENELEALENKVEKLIVKFAKKTGLAVHALFIEYMANEESDTIFPVAFASFDCPHEHEENHPFPLDLSPYGVRGVN